MRLSTCCAFVVVLAACSTPAEAPSPRATSALAPALPETPPSASPSAPALVTAGARGITTRSLDGTSLETVSHRPVVAAILRGTVVFAVETDGAVRAYDLDERREHVLVAADPELHGPGFDSETCRFEAGEVWLDVSSISLASSSSGCTLAITRRDDPRDDEFAVETVARVDLASGHTAVELTFSRPRFEELGLRVPACASSQARSGVRPPAWVRCEPARDARAEACPQPAVSTYRFNAEACAIVGPEAARMLPTFDDRECMVARGPCHASELWQVLSVEVMPGDHVKDKHLVLDRESGRLFPLLLGAWPPPLDDEGLEVFADDGRGSDRAGRPAIESLKSGAYVGRLRYLGFGEYFSHGSRLVQLGGKSVDLDDEILGILNIPDEP
jgi:hypothetical protein